MSVSIVWFRNDFRLNDNAALHHACKNSQVVYPVYILETENYTDWPIGSAARVWLHAAIRSLVDELNEKDSKLILRQGEAATVLSELIEATGADSVYWNRRYEPASIEHDSELKKQLRDKGIQVESFAGNLLREPQEVSNKQGNPYKVFTPFWKFYQSLGTPQPPLATPRSLKPPQTWPKSWQLEDLDLLPSLDWYQSIEQHWRLHDDTATKALSRFLNRIEQYDDDRDFPAVDGVSGLSPYLHSGQITSRYIWHKVLQQEQNAGRLSPSKKVLQYLRQLVWREFAHHLLYHFPHTTDQPLREEFRHFPWKENSRLLKRWQKGQTGYPLVDAGMRQLWSTGWMHNRVRMIVASFLIKDCLIHWREGAAWFWDTLVDADLANNSLGWQWVAGSGADAAPYFRIFNPVTQSEKFDSDGEYIRQWVPELKKLDNKWIHKPWAAPDDVLEKAQVRLGKTYPEPVLDHAEAREQALAALQQMNELKD